MHAPGPPLDPRPALLAEQTGTLLRCHVGTCSSAFTGEGVRAPSDIAVREPHSQCIPIRPSREVRHLGFHPDDLRSSNEFMYLRSGGAAVICRFQRMPKSRQYMRSHRNKALLHDYECRSHWRVKRASTVKASREDDVAEVSCEGSRSRLHQSHSGTSRRVRQVHSSIAEKSRSRPLDRSGTD
jgi:hypothetical protein